MISHPFQRYVADKIILHHLPICQRTLFFVVGIFIPSTPIYNKPCGFINKEIEIFLLEALTGIEPVSADYETAILPLN